MTANFELEIASDASADFLVFGVDEVGRGPLAGPVVAAAVNIPINLWEKSEVAAIEDSKKVNPRKRAYLAAWIKKHCSFSVAQVNAAEIDKINILQASLAAMARSLEQVPADFALIDGNKIPITPVSCMAVVKGDSKSKSIAAASIIAKEYRDSIMVRLAKEFPNYGWSKNSGYPTAEHRAALQKYGPTLYHRATFNGVKNVTKT